MEIRRADEAASRRADGREPATPTSPRASTRAPTSRPEALLTLADHYGTLAAARSLGRAGIGVLVADARRFVPALYSRYVARTRRCPDVGTEPARFVEWLLETGAREPGRVLYATSDDVAWLLARHRDALARDYRGYFPDAAALYTLLNKWRLYQACVAAGVDAPQTWRPRSEDELRAVQREARFPLMIKPQTQVFLWPHQKGRVARDAGSLAAAVAELRAATRYAPMLLEHDPEAVHPIVQTFAAGAADGIYNLSGFVDESGELFVAQASRKVLQWPRQLGVGLCFEEATVRPELARGVARLCREVGYYGAFEVEFVEVDGRHLLIDFNPRFYGQMAFDVSRGLDLPRLVYLAAIGDRDGLRDAVAQARRAARDGARRIYCHRIELELVLRLHRLAGSMSRDDARRWRAWLADARGRASDPVLDRDDWAPAAVDAAIAVLRRVSHPRATWRAARRG